MKQLIFGALFLYPYKYNIHIDFICKIKGHIWIQGTQLEQNIF